MTEPGVGHNSSVSALSLKSFIERIERLEDEKKNIGTDIKEVYSEAKGMGFDPKIMRRAIMLRRRDPSDLAEEDAILTLYMGVLEGVPTPSGGTQAALLEG